MADKDGKSDTCNLPEKKGELRQTQTETQTQTQSQQKFSRRITEEISCPICLDILVRPLTLAPCGHSFCKSCFSASSLSSSSSSSPSSMLAHCPQCRQPVEGSAPSRRLAGLIETLVAVPNALFENKDKDRESYLERAKREADREKADAEARRAAPRQRSRKRSRQVPRATSNSNSSSNSSSSNNTPNPTAQQRQRSHRGTGQPARSGGHHPQSGPYPYWHGYYYHHFPSAPVPPSRSAPPTRSTGSSSEQQQQQQQQQPHAPSPGASFDPMAAPLPPPFDYPGAPGDTATDPICID